MSTLIDADVRLTAHPYADAWPLMVGDELDELTEDIATQGLLQPIILLDGLILDGRNRYAACLGAGVPPVFEDYTGDDPLSFVQSANGARRHQSKGSKAASWALMMLTAEKRQDGRWSYREGNSEISQNLTGRMRADLGLIADYAPHLLVQVRDDQMTLNAAYVEAQANRAEEERRAEEEQQIEAEESAARASLPPAYVALIGTKYQSARVAFAAWEDDNRAAAAELRRKKVADEKRVAAELRVRRDRYGAMCRAVSNLRGWGAYHDVPKVMDGYDPAELDPHLLAQELDPQNLRLAAEFIDGLIKWKAGVQ